MTHHPGPAPGPFLCKLFETLQSSFVRTFAHFTAFFARLFPPFGPFFMLALFCSFGLLGVAFCGSFAAFFCAVFCFVCGSLGEIATGRRSRQRRGRVASFFVRDFFAFCVPSSSSKAAQTEAGAAPDPRPGLCPRFQSFPVPLLCHFCAATAAHGCPPQHTPNN